MNTNTITVKKDTQKAMHMGSDSTRKPDTARAYQAKPVGAAQKPIRILCVDDHEVLIEGLRVQFSIDEGLEMVGSLPTADNLIEEARRLKPDAVLLDIEMPGADAFETADRLMRALPDLKIIILSAHVRDAFIAAAFKAGICGYFSKTDKLEDIVSGIHEVMRGRTGSFVLGPKARARCVLEPRLIESKSRVSNENGDRDADGENAPATLLSSLTPREFEVLRLIGKGYSRNTIASQLCRSAKTIDAHQSRMMKKLGINSRADLMRFAIREGLSQA